MKVTVNGRTISVDTDAINSITGSDAVVIITATPQEIRDYVEAEDKLLSALKSAIKEV